MRSLFSNTVTSCPARASCCAQARPAGPEPTTATFFPLRWAGGCGRIQPSSHALSTIACSIDLMPTGSSLMRRTQASSQGAGQTRPVNSGKLLVECSVSMASFQSPRYTRSFQSGMMSLTGQPDMQNGMPQSMQLAPELRLLLRLGDERLERDHGGVAMLRKRAVLVEHVGDATGHAGSKVSSGDPQDEDRAAGHVLAAMVADTFHDGGRAGVAHREALARHAAEIGLALDGAVQDDVAGDDVLGRLAAKLGRGLHRDTPA